MEMIQDRSGFLVDKHEEHGDVFVSRALVRDLMFVRDPGVVYGINVTHWSDFHKPDYIKSMWKPFLGNGLVPNDGESWKRQHKLILPGFHKKRVDAYAETMVEFTERMLGRWDRDFTVDSILAARPPPPGQFGLRTLADELRARGR